MQPLWFRGRFAGVRFDRWVRLGQCLHPSGLFLSCRLITAYVWITVSGLEKAREVGSRGFESSR